MDILIFMGLRAYGMHRGLRIEMLAVRPILATHRFAKTVHPSHPIRCAFHLYYTNQNAFTYDRWFSIM